MKKLYFFLPTLLCVSIAHSLTELPPINFGGGVDYQTDCSEIKDNRACDSSNMISDLNGTAFKRNGSQRYVNIALSSSPINSLYRAYISSGNSTNIQKILLSTSKGSVYVSTDDNNPQWIEISSGLTGGQHYNFITDNRRVVFTGDSLQDPIKQYDFNASSVTDFILNFSTENIKFNAKYLLPARRYLVAGNIALVSTSTRRITEYFPTRIYWSILNNFSSMTALRFDDIDIKNGEEITGLGEMLGNVHIFSPSSIHELSFTSLDLIVNGGDRQIQKLVEGFGVIAPRTLVNTGQFYIFLSKDGIRTYDGGRRNRLNSSDESKVISNPINNIIENIAHNNSFNNCSAIYYPKKQWYIFSYENSEKSPHGKANSVMVYDIILDEWFPFNNWNAESFTIGDGILDNGILFYGQSDDGYIFKSDIETAKNDARQELHLHSMDRATDWNRGVHENRIIIEGTGSIKMTLPAGGSGLTSNLRYSSVSYMNVINIGEWADKTPITKSDLLHFRVLPTSFSNLTSFRVDLEINDIVGDFDNNITSVTISTNALTSGNSSWTTVEISLSSFPILNSWTDIASEDFPFANTLTFYGIRFFSTGTAGATLYIDDVRIVQTKERPLNAFRLSKQINLGTNADKQYRQLLLSTEKPDDSKFTITALGDFASESNSIPIDANISQELFVAGLNGSENISKLDSVNFSLIASSLAGNSSVFAIRPYALTDKYIFGGDQFNNRIIKIDKSNLTTFVSTYGSLGSGTTNFNLIFQMAVDDSNNLYVCDFGNQRLKIHRQDNLEFIKSYGTLGQNTTSFHNPTGVAVDRNHIFIAQDGNYAIQKITKSTGGYVTSINLNLNTVGNTTLSVDENFLYDAYDTRSDKSGYQQDTKLEKRRKSDLKLVNSIILRPQGVADTVLSTYCLVGDISNNGDFIFVSFTDDANRNGNYYIQKRLKSDFSIVKELKSNTIQFSPNQNGLAFRPIKKLIAKDIALDSNYVQFLYAESGLDNSMNLINQSLLVIPQPIREK